MPLPIVLHGGYDIVTIVPKLCISEVNPLMPKFFLLFVFLLFVFLSLLFVCSLAGSFVYWCSIYIGHWT